MPLRGEGAGLEAFQNGHSRCFLCGRENPNSLGLTFEETEDGGVRTRFESRSELQGYDDILHGGIIATLLDGAMTHCLFHRGIRAVTGDLHVRFVHSVPCGVSVVIRAWVHSSRAPFHRLRAELKLEEELMAWAEASFMEHRKPVCGERPPGVPSTGI